VADWKKLIPSPHPALGRVIAQPSLTVRETLRFSAMLHLPRGMEDGQKHARVEAVLQQLGLRGCADTLVGGEEVKGISGGEKRRLSLGVQMLLDPSVLLL
jgi:ABC-type multidrug transport system ATPase subunit